MESNCRTGAILSSGATEGVPVQQLSLEAPLFPLSSRPKRSEVERSLCGCSFLEMFFFFSVAQHVHQVQIPFCLANIAHDLLLQELWRGPASLLAKPAVKEQPQGCLVLKLHRMKIEQV
jgi:hypothetical protein